MAEQSETRPETPAKADEAAVPAPASPVPVVKQTTPAPVATKPADVPVGTPAASAPKEPAAKAAAPKPAPAKPAPAKPASAKSAKPASRRAKPAARKATPRPVPAFAVNSTVTELKEKIMATKNTAADLTGMMSKSMTDAVAEMQAKAQEAYDKGTGMVSEMTEMAKGNVEALVESGKILAAGVQDMTKSYAEEAKAAYETMTADLKEMASVKSPTELFQLQGKILRRNFDAMMASTSKAPESAMKLANDVMAPITARVNLAVEKISKAA